MIQENKKVKQRYLIRQFSDKQIYPNFRKLCSSKGIARDPRTGRVNRFNPEAKF